MSLPVWVNGRDSTQIGVADRGLAYGDGIFETIRIANTRAVLLEAHFARLFSSADFFGIALNAAAVRDAFSLFLAVCPAHCVVKIIITRGEGGRGYLPSTTALPTVIFSAHETPAYPADYERSGIVATVLSARLGTQPLLAGHKHLNRLEQVLLRRELAAHTYASEALVCDAQGSVVEGVFHNVFAIKNNALLTPSLKHAGVRGVMREAVIAQAAILGVAVHEGRYTVDDFFHADALFFCNSVSGIWPVHTLYAEQRHTEQSCSEGSLTQALTEKELLKADFFKKESEKELKNFNQNSSVVRSLQDFWRTELSVPL